MSGPRIESRDARRLTVDELRRLVRVADSQREDWNLADGTDAQAILDMHHAASDAGWVDWEAFWEEARPEAERVYRGKIMPAARRRAARGN